MRTTKLVVLRGPSGAGKSTVAKELFKAAQPSTVFIEQDYYRFIFKPAGARHHSKVIHKMILQNVLIALDDGYDVILEGILNMHAYSEVLAEIVRKHPKENYFFFYDISLEESLRRHRLKKTDLWTEEDMRDWYKPHDVTGYDFEHIIGEDSSLKQTVAYIKRTAGI